MSASFNGLEYFVTLTPNFKHSFKADFASFFVGSSTLYISAILPAINSRAAKPKPSPPLLPLPQSIITFPTVFKFICSYAAKAAFIISEKPLLPLSYKCFSIS